jgi:hypothetical protein
MGGSLSGFVIDNRFDLAVMRYPVAMLLAWLSVMAILTSSDYI